MHGSLTEPDFNCKALLKVHGKCSSGAALCQERLLFARDKDPSLIWRGDIPNGRCTERLCTGWSFSSLSFEVTCMCVEPCLQDKQAGRLSVGWWVVWAHKRRVKGRF